MPGPTTILPVSACFGWYLTQYLPSGTWQQVGEMPSWLNLIYNDVDSSIIGVTGLAGDLGTFDATFYYPGHDMTYIFRFTITNCDNLDVVNVECEDRVTTLVWLNQAGGYSSFNFDTKRIYGYTAGEASDFLGRDGVRRFDRRENGTKTLRLSTGPQSKKSMDYLETMFDAIQVWGWDLPIPNIGYIFEDSPYVPVIIDPKDRDKYRDGQSLEPFEFTIRIAEEKIIQTQ